MSTHNWRDRRLQGEFNSISALRAASQSRGEAASVAAMDERIQALIFADQTGDGALLNFMDLNAGFDAATQEKFAASMPLRSSTTGCPRSHDLPPQE